MEVVENVKIWWMNWTVDYEVMMILLFIPCILLTPTQVKFANENT